MVPSSRPYTVDVMRPRAVVRRQVLLGVNTLVCA